jgi:hypothetical protein
MDISEVIILHILILKELEQENLGVRYYSGIVRFNTFNLKKGQFWAIYGNCSTQGKDAVRFYFEQLDSLKRLFKRYPETFAFTTNANGMYIIKLRPT